MMSKFMLLAGEAIRMERAEWHRGFTIGSFLEQTRMLPGDFDISVKCGPEGSLWVTRFGLGLRGDAMGNGMMVLENLWNAYGEGGEVVNLDDIRGEASGPGISMDWPMVVRKGSNLHQVGSILTMQSMPGVLVLAPHDEILDGETL